MQIKKKYFTKKTHSSQLFTDKNKFKRFIKTTSHEKTTIR